LAPFSPPTPAGVVPDSPLAHTLADVKVGPLPPPQEPPPGVPGPYFEYDRLLDPAALPPVGWFGSAEAHVADPHVRYWSNLRGPVLLPGGLTNIVSVPGANLSWTVVPDLQVGFRLPSGFGEFTLSGQYLASDGSQVLPGPDGPSNVHSRLDLTQIDFDYRSREFSLWPCRLDMQWWAGFRYANIYFDSVQNTSSVLATAGTGVDFRHVTNRFVGIGPHAGLELAYFLHGRQWSLLGRFEWADFIGRIRQSYAETTTAVGPGGLPVGGGNGYSSSQEVPMISTQIGLRWMPNVATELFVGYQFEYFWNAGRESTILVATASNSGTMGEVYDHAIVARFTWNF
jgi:hypothetical protein